jgi:gliding motility-associated-like protein
MNLKSFLILVLFTKSILGFTQAQYFTTELNIFDPVLIKNCSELKSTINSEFKYILPLNDGSVLFTPHGFTWYRKANQENCESLISIAFEKANPNPIITEDNIFPHYFTFGKIRHLFSGSSRIIYHDLYPNIDWIVDVSPAFVYGFKYTWKLKPGANLNSIQYSSTSKISIHPSKKELSFLSSNDTLYDDGLVAYNHEGQQFNSHFVQSNNAIQIQVNDYNSQTDTLYIDPWVSKINSLTRLRNKDSVAPDNIGANLDYDYQNNIYVYGGQSLSASSWDTTIRFSGFKVAKFDRTGNLKWIFSGDIALPGFPARYVDETLSNILVNKSTGKLLVGCNNIIQEPAQLIQLDTNGMYDNVTFDTSYRLHAIDELQFNPNADNVIVFGNRANYQGDSIEINIKEIGKSSIDKTVTGRQFPSKKQVLCAAQDYSGTAHIRFCTYEVDTSITNYVYSTPQNYLRYQFKSPSGLMVDSNAFHWRRYRINGLKTVFYGATNDLAANDNYLFESDGKSISAIDKSKHKSISTRFITTNRKKALATGIAVDPCNHVFVAGDSGNIYCLSFNGSTFSLDTQILIWGKKVPCVIQDLKYNPNAGQLFATGDSFVGSFTTPYKCVDGSLDIETSAVCDGFIAAKLKNPDTASTYTFQWTSEATAVTLQTNSARYHFQDTLLSSKVGEKYALRIYRNLRIGGYYRDYTFQRFPNSASTQSLQFCAADTWIHNGVPYLRDTTFTDSLKNQFGCDSLIQYKLTFKPRSFTFLNPKICRGDSFSVGKRAYRISGNYADTFTNVRGCDSIVNTSLTVLTDTSLSIKTAICLGDTIRFNNLPFFATGSYQIKIIRSNGCDSVINLQLTVNPPQFVSQQLSLCNIDSFSYRIKKYPLPLSLRDTLSAFTGCDSVFTLSVISHNIKSDFSIDSSQFPTLKFIGKTTNAKQWIWDFGDLNSSNIQSPNHSYVKSFQWIKYKVCLVVRDSFGCDDTLCLNLPIKPEAEIQIPEGISPNGDGINDTLVIPGLWAFPKATWVIFNRWGQVVFESNAQQNIAWDGKNHASGQNQNNTSAELLPEGVYFIVFNYNDGHRPTLTKNVYLKR